MMDEAHGGMQSGGPQKAVPERTPPEMAEVQNASAAETPKTPQSAAAERIGKRYKEMLESECQMCEDMQQLIATLTLLSQDKAWKLRPEHVQLIQRTCSTVHDLVRVHSAIREKMAMFAGCTNALTEVFTGSQEEMVTVHGEFQTLSTCVMVVLQKKAGGQVIGDRAVGTTLKAEGSLAAALAPVQDLLVRPSQRVMKYSLFLDEMAADARRSEQFDVEKTLRETLKVVRGITMDINERIRGIQRRERVQMIATRVRAVPSDMSIVKVGREFIMDDHKFREKGRAGYRSLYLFNDSVLVCKTEESKKSNMLRNWWTQADQDLKFKRLIPLSSLKPSEYPVVCNPDSASLDSPDSPGGVQALSYFELRDGVGTCAFHHSDRDKVVEWVAALLEALKKCEQTGPQPAYRLPNSQEDMALLSQDLSGLDLSDYVLLEHGEAQDSSTPTKSLHYF